MRLVGFTAVSDGRNGGRNESPLDSFNLVFDVRLLPEFLGVDSQFDMKILSVIFWILMSLISPQMGLEEIEEKE